MSSKNILLWAVAFSLLSLLASEAYAANPGHPASAISSGTFESGNYVFPANLNVTSNLYVGGGFGSSGLTADSSGNLFLDGSLTFSGDTYTVHAMDVNGSIVPFFNNQLTLGNSTNQWASIYGTNLYSSNVNVTTGQLFLPNGAVGSPSLTFSSDTDTGLYTTGGANLLVSISGSDLAAFYGDGLAMNVGGTASSAAIQRGGGDADTGLYWPGSNQIALTAGGTARIFVDGANNGNVGIGTTIPNATLQVKGNFSVAGSPTDDASFFYDNANVGDTTNGQSLYVYRRAAEGDAYMRLYVDQYQGPTIDTGGRGLKLNAGSSGLIEMWTPVAIGASWMTSGYNYPLTQYGYITAAGTSKYVQWQVNDATDNFELTRQDPSIAKFDVQMPMQVSSTLNVTANISTPTLCLSGDCKSAWPAGGASPWTNDTNYIYTAAAYPTKVNITGNLSMDTSTLFVDSTQHRVGIGTTSPTQDNLQLKGTMSILGPNLGKKLFWLGFTGNGITSETGFMQIFADNEVPTVQISANSLDSTYFNAGNIGIHNTTPASTLMVNGTFSVMNVSGTQGLYQDANGRVGVGTAEPTQVLDIVGASEPGIAIRSTNAVGASANLYLVGRDGGSDNWATINGGWDGSLQFAPASGSGGYRFYTNNWAAIAMAIDGASGNVGIGTTSPSAKLEVNGSGSSGLSLNVSNSLFVNGTSGNVGIGTSNPSALLTIGNGSYPVKFTGNEIPGDNIGQLEFYGGQSWQDAMTFYSSGGDKVGYFYNHGYALEIYAVDLGNNGAASLYLSKDSGVSLKTQDTQRLTVALDGNVGIGNTTPASTLMVNGTFSVMNGSGAQGLYQDANGRVGIGNANPTHKLSIVSSSDESDIEIRSTNAVGASADIFLVGRNGEGDHWATLGAGWDGALHYTPASGSSGHQFYTNGGASTAMTIAGASGNVGIGTTSPTSKLHINGTGGTTPIALISSSSDAAYLGINSSTGYGSGIKLIHDNSAKWNIFAFPNNNDLKFYADNGGAGEVLYMNYTSGNVGVGTNSPGYKLDVTGDIRTTGSVQLTTDGLSLGSNSLSDTGTLYLQYYSPTQDVDFQSGKVIFKGTGNVGINTTSPTNKLTVVGDINATVNVSTPTLCLSGDCKSAWPTSGGTSPWANDSNYIYNAASYPTKVNITGNLDVYDRMRLRTGSSGKAGIWFANTTETNTFIGLETDTAGSEKIGIYQNGWGLIMDSNRNVGIGTTTLSSTLTVNGTFSVMNTSGTQGLYQDMNGSVGIGTTKPGQSLTVQGDMTSNISSGYLSTGNMLISQIEGGAYFGRVGLRESQWAIGDYGASWVQKNSTALGYECVAMSSDGKVQTAVVLTGGIYSSTDYGNTWAQKDSTVRNYLSVAMSSDGKVQTAVVNSNLHGQGIYVSTDYGATWAQKDSNARAYRGVAMSSDGKVQTAVVYGSVAGQGIYVSTDYGSTWIQKNNTAQNYFGVAMSSDGKVQTAVTYASSDGGIYSSTDYGNTWAQKDSTSRWYYGVAMSSDGKVQTAVVYGSARGQGIYVSTDYGVNWIQRDSSVSNYYSVAMSSDGKVQTAVASSQGINVSTDYGATWAQKDSSGLNYYSVAMSSDGKVQTAVVSGGGVYVSYSSVNTLGNVGIGTSNPVVKLAVNSTSANTTAAAFYYNGTRDSTTGGGGIISVNNVDNSSSSQGGILFNGYDTGGSSRHGGAILWGKESNWIGASGIYPGFLAFWTRQSGSSEFERMRITSTGNVGIGTASPNATLEVNGESSGFLNSSAERARRDVYSPVSWTDTGSTLPNNLTHSQLAIIGDYVYLFGGYTDYLNGLFNKTIFKAPVSNPTNWSDTGSTIPVNLSYSHVAVIGDYVYLFGGYNASGGYTNRIYRAPVSNPTSWADSGSYLPGNIEASQLAVIGDYVYLFGGYNSAGVDVIYRAPVSNPLSWSDTGYKLPTNLYLSNLAIVGDYVYLFGGISSGSGVKVIYRAPVSNATNWADTGYTLPNYLYGSQAAVIGDYVYLFGGANNSVYTDVIYRAPVSNATNWVDTGSRLPRNVALSQLALIGDYVYLFGGYDWNTDLNVIYRAGLQSSEESKFWKYAPNIVKDRYQSIAGTAISTDGNGGINIGNGTIASSEKLHVENGWVTIRSNAAVMKLLENDNGNAWWVVADNNRFSIRMNNTTPYPLLIDGNKNVILGAGGGAVGNNMLDVEGVNGGYAGIYLNVAVPSSTSNTLYNNGSNLMWNGVALATGSSLSGTTGKIAKFTGSGTVGDSIMAESGNNIGIGVGTSPAFALDILAPAAGNDGVQITRYADANTPGLMIRRAGGSSGSPTATAATKLEGFITFQGWDTSAWGNGANIYGRAESTFSTTDHNTSLEFYTTSATTNTEKMHIASTGKVGIGTASPAGRLDVNATGMANALLINDTTGFVSLGVGSTYATAYGYLQVNGGIASNSTYSGLYFQDRSNLTAQAQWAWYSTAGDGRLWYGTGGTKMSMNGTSGNLGIGTTGATATLEANGGIRMNTTTSKPTCDYSQRGTMWFEQSAGGTDDYLYACMRNSTSNYNWVMVARGS